MDTRATPEQVAESIAIIKSRMPQTYRGIQEKSKEIGNQVYQLVRRGLAGEPNCFWAMEGGYVMGTPFNLVDVQRDVAWAMAAFGCAHACIFPMKGIGDGAH